MGDRAQVKIVSKYADTPVYLYTHWGASDLDAAVFRAVAKKWRWDDHEYLTRIIFDEMTMGSQGEETGFGIGTSLHGDVWRVIEVNCDTQTISIVDNGELAKTVAFEDAQKALDDLE